MEGERFLGSEVKEEEVEEGGERCEGGTVGHDVLFVGRQDQWNPVKDSLRLALTPFPLAGAIAEPLQSALLRIRSPSVPLR
jgi:hypothetical protein